MYQIVFTSDFIRDLQESTNPNASVVPQAIEPTPAPQVAPGPARAAKGVGPLGLIFGAALRLLGAH